MRLVALLLIACYTAAGEWVPLVVEATAYCPGRCCCGPRAHGRTSTGVRVRDVPYGIASVPRTIPYGTQVWIPAGLGYLDNQTPNDADRVWTVDDTGGALWDDEARRGVVRIDLRFIHHSSAVRFGRRRITIYTWKD